MCIPFSSSLEQIGSPHEKRWQTRRNPSASWSQAQVDVCVFGWNLTQIPRISQVMEKMKQALIPGTVREHHPLHLWSEDDMSFSCASPDQICKSSVTSKKSHAEQISIVSSCSVPYVIVTLRCSCSSSLSPSCRRKTGVRFFAAPSTHVRRLVGTASCGQHS